MPILCFYYQTNLIRFIVFKNYYIIFLFLFIFFAVVVVVVANTIWLMFDMTYKHTVVFHTKIFYS